MNAEIQSLTGALEDYLETIYELRRDHKVVRIKDIAQARGVRSASVTPAMKRLAELGLIQYAQREYIDLTPAGERQAARVFARHVMLTRFFVDVLAMSPQGAEVNACAMEHSMTGEALDHLVRFFEYLEGCHEGEEFLQRFHRCGLMRDPERGHACAYEDFDIGGRDVSQLRPGEQATVTHVQGNGAIRQRLLDMGILPNTTVEVERIAPAGDPIWIKVQGFQVSLRKKEAASVKVA